MSDTYQNTSYSDCCKPSKYNITIPYERGGGIVYNSLTGARIVVPEQMLTTEQMTALEARDWPTDLPLPDPVVRAMLRSHGFFVDTHTDELGAMLSFRETYAHNPKLRRVTVILTRRCNLGCSYCFQDKDVGDSDADKARVLRYLASQIVPSGVLQVTWFGGEPTLRLKLIYELSDAIIAACEAQGTTYSGTISTNGVRLNPESIAMLLARRVMYYQITLDGPSDVQELRRPSLNGRLTYGRIVDNIARLVEGGAEVTIKVIVDRENYQDVPRLFRDLGCRQLLGDVKVAIQHTEGKYAASGYEKRFSSLEEFSAVKLQLLKVLSREGYCLNEPSRRPEFCAATSPFATTIDMAGNMFRCGTEVVNITGSVSPDGSSGLVLNQSYEEMFTKRRFAHSMCENCKVLPICGGGCTVAAEGLAERDICSFYRVGIKDYLLMLEKNGRQDSVETGTSAESS